MIHVVFALYLVAIASCISLLMVFMILLLWRVLTLTELYS